METEIVIPDSVTAIGDIDENNVGPILKLLETGKFVTAKNIMTFIDYANSLQKTESERYNSRFKSTGQERLWIHGINAARNLNTIAHNFQSGFCHFWQRSALLCLFSPSFYAFASSLLFFCFNQAFCSSLEYIINEFICQN